LISGEEQMEDYTTLLGKALGYAETWWQNPGYGSLIVHPCWSTTNLHFIGLRTSSNGEGLSGFLELYEKFRSKRWLERAIECAEVLVSLAQADGCFRNSTGEGDPEEGCLIHNARPDIELLRLAALLRRERRNSFDASRYTHVAKRNIEWFIEHWWNGRTFCETINQDLCACIAMALYGKLEGDGRYSDYILKVIDYIEGMVQAAGEVKGAIQRSYRPGGRIFATNYQAAKALFLLELSEVFAEGRLLPMAKGAAAFVSRQQRPDGLFSWGYMEQEGEIVKRELPLVYSIGIARCGYEFERLGVKMDWRRYLNNILRDIPMRLAARGFAGYEEGDWRNGIPSASNISLIGFLTKLSPEKPEVIPFDGVVISEGIDAMAGEGSYVYLETAELIVRIRDDCNPALDYLASKKAELPIAFPSMDGGVSFCVFGDERDEGWHKELVESQEGKIIYRAGKKTRAFGASGGAITITQHPFSSGEIYFEVLPRGSLFYCLQSEKQGQPVSVPFTRENGRKETILRDLEDWFTVTNWSPRLRYGDVRVSFNTAIRRLKMDHVAANPYGKLRVWVELMPREDLTVKIEPRSGEDYMR